MNTNKQEHKASLEKSTSASWHKRSTSIIVTLILTAAAALAIVIGVEAYELADITGGTDNGVLSVPIDFPTIQAAINAASPGDIIRISPGVYHENLTLGKPVSLVAESFDPINPANNTAIIDGGGQGKVILIPSGLTQMPTIRGFVIQNGSNDILALSRFVAEFNYIRSAGTLVSYQQDGGGFNRSNVYFGAANSAIHLNDIDSPLTIENNRIIYNGTSGIEVNLQAAAVSPATTVEIDIRNNMIIGNNQDGLQFIDHAGGPQNTNRRFWIAGNLIANNKMAGIGIMPNADTNNTSTVENFSGAGMAEAVRVFNNTFYGNNYGISGGGNLTAFNNIIANSLTRGTWRVQNLAVVNAPVSYGQPLPANSVIAYDLFFNNQIDADQSNLGVGVILGVDPHFEAAPNAGPDGTWGTVDDDFSGLVLRSDSPAIDKGIAQFRTNSGELVPPSPITDFTGSAPDLGWREFGAPIFASPTPTALSSVTPAATAAVESLTPAPTQTVISASTTPLPVTATPVPQTPLPTATGIAASPTAPASPTLGVAPTTAASSSTPTQTALIVQSINPNTAQANASVSITITGAGFQNGAVVSFEGGQGLPQEVQSIQVVNSTTLVVLVHVQNNGTAAQVWDVRVTNPDSSTSILMQAFTVTPIP
jgi:hypothetical protein